MNILQKCSLVDRQRNSLISLDDLIEDRFGLQANLHDPIEFYLMLYFNANWLPEVSNAALNQKLSDFYTKEGEKKQFELIFISSDKTIEQFNLFLKKNKFIRYSLFFEDQSLKVRLSIFKVFFCLIAFGFFVVVCKTRSLVDRPECLFYSPRLALTK